MNGEFFEDGKLKCAVGGIRFSGGEQQYTEIAVGPGRVERIPGRQTPRQCEFVAPPFTVLDESPSAQHELRLGDGQAIGVVVSSVQMNMQGTFITAMVQPRRMSR